MHFCLIFFFKIFSVGRRALNLKSPRHEKKNEKEKTQEKKAKGSNESVYRTQR